MSVPDSQPHLFPRYGLNCVSEIILHETMAISSTYCLGRGCMQQVEKRAVKAYGEQSFILQLYNKKDFCWRDPVSLCKLQPASPVLLPPAERLHRSWLLLRIESYSHSVS